MEFNERLNAIAINIADFSNNKTLNPSLYLEFYELYNVAIETDINLNKQSIFSNNLNPYHLGHVAMYCAEVTLQSLTIEDIRLNKTTVKLINKFLPEIIDIDPLYHNAILRGLYNRVYKILIDNSDSMKITEIKDFSIILSDLEKVFSDYCAYSERMVKKIKNNPNNVKYYIDGFNEIEYVVTHPQPKGFAGWFNRLIHN